MFGRVIPHFTSWLDASPLVPPVLTAEQTGCWHLIQPMRGQKKTRIADNAGFFERLSGVQGNTVCKTTLLEASQSSKVRKSRTAAGSCDTVRISSLPEALALFVCTTSLLNTSR